MRPRLCFALFCCFLVSVRLGAQPQQYKVPPIYTPPLDREKMDLSEKQLPYNAAGATPTFDGDFFTLSFPTSEAKGSARPEEIRPVVTTLLEAMNWKRPADELRFVKSSKARGASQDVIEQEIKRSQDSTQRRLKGRFGKTNKATDDFVNEMAETLRKQTQGGTEAFVFDQEFKGIKIEHAGVVATVRGGAVASVAGRVFNTVNLTNRDKLTAAQAARAAEAHINKTSRAAGISTPQTKVILPYGSGLRYAWKMDVSTEEGPYEVWVDAENGNILQLEPLFSYDAGRGLVFNPNPNVGTQELLFEVDGPSSNLYRLRLNNVLDVNNNGADGQSNNDLTIAGGSGITEANFNVNPINGAVVNRTNQANYNSRFQEVNVYAWVHEMRKNYTSWGSQTFPFITATVNHNNPCGFGINNACASGTTSLTFGIGSATTGTSTSCSALFNSAIDVTVVAHEFGHILNRLQYNAAGGTIITSINEGLADYWACTNFSTDTFGAFWNNNCNAPVQSSFVPRQADAQDIFPEHITNFGDGFPHSNGQIICWALWNSRQEMLDQSALGAFVLNLNLIAAMAQSGVGVLSGITDKRVHDSYLNLLQQLVPRFDSSRTIHKILSGFARAGIFLQNREAIIDINDDFLDRDDANGPTFTVWTGRDFGFTGETANNTQNFNTSFSIDVANDEAFTVNLVSSGFQGGVVSGAGGTATWQLPAANWNTLKAQDQLFYRITTQAGRLARFTRRSGFTAARPPGKAVINGSGQCECSCSASAKDNPKPFALIAVLPLVGAVLWRRALKKKERAYATENC
ncbi:MAG: hypothetical protein HY961_04465 [Ignavibacteriae bacterium]|nr:hypothetical protein [Ignavibacteriota bacterium]